MKKIKVLVVMGGPSAEHEVSVISGQQVIANLNPDKFNVLPVVVSKDGKKWQLSSRENILNIKDPMTLKGSKKDVALVSQSISPSAADVTQGERPDVVFIAMHGTFGEDGKIQAIIEATGVPYTGSGVLASAVGMDKVMFRKVMQAEGLPVPKYVVCDKNFNLTGIIKTLGRFPYFVKPVSQGSSVGASIAKNKKELLAGILVALQFDSRVLVDEFIEGTEVTCGILGNENPKALPVTMIQPLKNTFFDYASKYTESGANEITPAPIGKPMTRKIQEMAIKVFEAIGAKGFGRVDFIIKKDGNPFILEINTIPGLTPMSLMPKAAVADGIKYNKLIEKIINFALKK